MIKPLADRIALKLIPSEEKTASGIVLPDSAKEKPQKGEVVAVGSGRVLENGTRMPSEVKVGDIVLFSKYSGMEHNIDGEKVLILAERDLLAILD
jgi:chaperonin GroES